MGGFLFVGRHTAGSADSNRDTAVHSRGTCVKERLMTADRTKSPHPKRHSAKASRDGSSRVHATAKLRDCILGNFTEIGERCTIAECEIGDYTYFERQCEAIYTTIGKFCAIAADVRLNALQHPMERVSQHKITYRPNEYFVGAKVDAGFRTLRQNRRVTIGHDVWIGHGAIILPEVTIGHGAVIAAGSVVSKDVAPYSIVAGVPARHIKWRFEPTTARKLMELAWWDWTHDKLADAVTDMQTLAPEAFVAKWR
jgi:phosphonate metabolism protein (transferase hexapeptide repeat family)